MSLCGGGRSAAGKVHHEDTHEDTKATKQKIGCASREAN